MSTEKYRITKTVTNGDTTTTQEARQIKNGWILETRITKENPYSHECTEEYFEKNPLDFDGDGDVDDSTKLINAMKSAMKNVIG